MNDSKNIEHSSDDTSSPESDDTKGDENNTSGNTRSSGNMATSTLDPDNMRIVDIDTGPAESTRQVYQTSWGSYSEPKGNSRVRDQTKVSPAKHSRTVGPGRLCQEQLPGRIEQPENTPPGNEIIESSPSRFASQRFKDGSNKQKSSGKFTTTAATSSAAISARSRPLAQFAQKAKWYERHTKGVS